MKLRSTDRETQEITLRLEHYDDIFSDFDARPYSKRALSIDFLDEVRRATADKSEEGIELVISVPEGEKSESHDATIRERLAEHFKKHYGILLREKRKIMRSGWLMVLLGIVAMIGATLILSEDPTHNLTLSFLVVFLEPAAWFLLWEGMDQILFASKEINPDLFFYKKMALNPQHIHFRSHTSK